MFIGEICALLSAITWALSVILFTGLGQTMPAFGLNLIKNCIGFVCLSLTATLVEGWFLPSLDSSDWLVVILSGVIGLAVADTLYLKALGLIGAGRMGVIATLNSPFVILISILYLNESLSLWQLVGLLMVISAILLLISEKKLSNINKRALYKGIGVGICAVFLTALSLVIVKPVLESNDFFSLAAARMGVGILAMLLFLVLTGNVIKTIAQYKLFHDWATIITASFTGAYIALGLWLAGYKYAEATTASILTQTNSVFIVLLAIIFLDESITPKKLLAAAISFSGVLLVLFN
jgi:drug/metabolite transporter (DMT)-like permease